jgi:hypothetical protein
LQKVRPSGDLTGLGVLRVNAFPDLGTMDRDIRIDLETQFHGASADLQHLNSEESMKSIIPADYHRLLIFPR